MTPRDRGSARPREREDVAAFVYGRHPVREALRARRRVLRKLCLRQGLRGGDIDALVESARAAGIPVEEITADALADALPPGANAQGVLLHAGALPTLSLAELTGEEGPRVLVALDGIEDPQNLGAIARAAEVAGAAGLILPQRRSAPLGAAATRASAGALEWLPVARVTNLSRALKELKEKGFWLFGGAEEAPRSVFELPDRAIDARYVLVLGGEGAGLRPGVRDALDHLVRVPVRGRVGSLNVAMAATVLLYELARRVGAAAEV